MWCDFLEIRIGDLKLSKENSLKMTNKLLVKEKNLGKQLICAKTGEETEGLDRQPYPGELGKKFMKQLAK